MDAPALGARLRQERERAGYTLARLATITGVSKTYLVRLETRRSNPSLQVLGRIAEAIGITVADLLGEEGLRGGGGEARVSASLRSFAEAEGLSPTDLRTLASIRFRKGEEPCSAERWRYIWTSLRLSRSIDRDAGG